MEPVTHALASLALGRAGLGRATPRAMPMLLISGLAADVDWASYTAGAPAFVEWRRTATHSLLGAAAISIAVAAAFWLWGRRGDASRRVALLPALAVCAAGAGLHLLLDLTTSGGVKLLWPFSARWFAWNLAQEVDPGLLAILLAGLLLPALFNLVGEEIGSRGKRQPPGMRGAIVALALAMLYMGGRAAEHMRAVALLNSHTYAQEAPLRAAAFPSASPLLWRGVIETETAMHQADVSLLPGAEFDPRTARSQFKPENSEALQRAVASDVARAFLAFARFPLASVEPTEDGVEVRIRDLRESLAGQDSSEIVAVIMVNGRGEVTRSALQFAASAAR